VGDGEGRTQEKKGGTENPSLDQLLAEYRSYGLPLPPVDAKLVRFESGGRYVLNGKLMPPTYFVGFLLRPGTKDKPALVLVGTQEISMEAYRKQHRGHHDPDDPNHCTRSLLNENPAHRP
jgi:hypothetical protein